MQHNVNVDLPVPDLRSGYLHTAALSTQLSCAESTGISLLCWLPIVGASTQPTVLTAYRSRHSCLGTRLEFTRDLREDARNRSY